MLVLLVVTARLADSSAGLSADPGSEGRDTGVDGGVGRGAASGSPGRGSNQLIPARRSEADQRTTGVTVAGSCVLIDRIEDADHVDFLVADAVLAAAQFGGDDGRLGFLQSNGQSAIAASTAPAGDVARLRLAVFTVAETAGHSDDSITVDGHGSSDNLYITTAYRVTKTVAHRQIACMFLTNGLV